MNGNEADRATRALLEGMSERWSVPADVEATLLERVTLMERQRDDMAMLIQMLASSLRVNNREHGLPGRAMDYLKRNGLEGSILRTPLSREEQEANLLDNGLALG